MEAVIAIPFIPLRYLIMNVFFVLKEDLLFHLLKMWIKVIQQFAHAKKDMNSSGTIYSNRESVCAQKATNLLKTVKLFVNAILKSQYKFMGIV